MGVKSTDFGSILIQQRVGFRGELKFPEAFLPTKIVGEGVFGRNENDNFGYSVSISGELAVVGVPSQDYDENGETSIPDAGAVLVYRRTKNSWEFAYKIVADDRENEANFGYSVSLHGTTLAVGAPKHSNALAVPVVGAGAAYVYSITATEATLESKLLPVVRDANDNFGSVVSAQDKAVYVGSHMHGRNEKDLLDAPAAGAVWAYHRNNTGSWVLAKKIVAGGNERNPGDNYGHAVGAHRNTLVVGVPKYDYVDKGTDLQTDAGIAFVYTWDTDHWVFKSTLSAPDRDENDLFGSSVAVYDRRIVIGAPGKNGNVGKVYVFALSDIGTYGIVEELLPTSLALPEAYEQPTGAQWTANARFGNAVSLNASVLVVGAPGQAGLNMTSVNDQVEPYTWVGSALANVGATYVYALDSESNATLTNKLTAADHLNDLLATRYPGQYGFSVSIGTDIVIVGEPYAARDANGLTTDSKTNAGIAHIYINNAGQFEYSKTVDGFYKERNADDFFATSFAQNDRFMVFGAPGQDYDANHENFTENAGAAYVWENVGGTWVFRQKIAAAARTAGAAFGTKVYVSGDRIFVYTAEANGSGSVCVFRFVDGVFVEKQRITHVDIAAGNTFGSVMLARDNRLFLSAPTHSILLSDSTTRAHGAVFAYVLNSATDTYDFDTKLVPSTAKTLNSNFGISLAFQDNVLVVGANGHNLDAGDGLALTNSGAAFVFANTAGTWSQINKLTGPGSDRSTNDFMGYAVSGYGNMLAVGVPGSDYDANLLTYLDDAGKVYIYNRVGDAWNLTATLESPNRATSGRFGASLSLGENRLVVGAPGESNVTLINGWGDGRAYVFDRVFGEWQPVATLENTEPAIAGIARRFGWSVNLDESRVVVGEPFNATNLSATSVLAGAGAAWIFEKTTTWENRGKLTQDNLAGRLVDANFGFSVDIKGDVIVVGSPYDKNNDSGGSTATAAGSACVFRRTETPSGVVTWTPEKKLAGWPQDRNQSDAFGTAIATFGNTVLISAPNHDYDANRENFVENAGAVFVYEWNNGTLQYKQKLVAHDPADRIANVGFGTSIAVNETHIIVGAPAFPKNSSGAITARQVGKVWSFRNENGFWVKERTFVSATTIDMDSIYNTAFGETVALSHLVLAIGAPGATYGSGQTGLINSGAVDVYRYNVDHWVFEKTLTPLNREQSDFFGKSIALRDNLAVIGGTASTSSTSSINNDNYDYIGGAAWVFQYEIPNWTLTSKVTRGNAARSVNDGFGNNVSISGNTMVVGAADHGFGPNGKIFTSGAGMAYVFKYAQNGWRFESNLYAPVRQVNEKFGASVCVKDDIIWVGAPGTLSNTTAVGSVYSFRRGAEHQITRLIRRTSSFVGTGSSQTFTVPAGVSEITAFVWGAAGAGSNTYVNGGNGGFVRVKIPVTEGEVLTLNVGTKPTAIAAGGGRSEIIRDGSTLVVAGGGGGVTNTSNIYSGTAGSAGGIRGEDGYSGNNAAFPGLGGSQTAGGASRAGSGITAGDAGSFKQGGSAPIVSGATNGAGGWPNGGASTYLPSNWSIGGGGDGWYGGSAGGIITTEMNSVDHSAPGGAGSSYIAPGIEGYTQTVKSDFDEALTYFPDIAYRPAVNNDGHIALEWFVEYEAEEWNFDSQVRPSTVTNNNFRFGEAIDFDGTTLLVGAPGDTHFASGSSSGADTGSAHVFEFNGFEWEPTGALFPFGNNSYGNYFYGTSLSIHGDTAVVGAPRHSFDEAGEASMVNAGIAFVYVKQAGQWTNLQRLGPPGAVRSAGDNIGAQIGYDADWIAVGASGHDYDVYDSDKKNNSGAVYLWKWEADTLVFKQKLVAPRATRNSNSLFGSVINFNNGVLLVSAPGGATTSGETKFRGAVYEYELNDTVWELKQTIEAPNNAHIGMLFGASLDRSGDTLAVGSPRSETSAISTDQQFGTTIIYTPKPFAAKVNPNSNWSFEIGFNKISTVDSFDLVQSVNYFEAGRNGTWALRVLGNGVSVLIKNGIDTVVTLTHIGLTNGWHNVGFQRVGDIYQLFVDGVFSTDTSVVGSTVALDMANGIQFGSTNHNRNKIVDFIRINNEAIDLALNEGESIGMRSSTVFYADYKNFTTGWDDLTGNFTGEVNNLSSVFFTDGAVAEANPAGTVKLFERDGDGLWAYTQTVMPIGTNANIKGDNFGSSVALVDDFLIVGSPNQAYDQDGRNSLTNAGASYFFQKIGNTWTQQQKLVAWGHDVTPGETVGSTMAAADTIIAVASPTHPYDSNGNNYLLNAGAVYVWRWNSTSWVLEQKITAPVREANAQFGLAMALTESRLAVGAPSTTDLTKSGRAFVFEKTAGDTALNCWNAGSELIATELQAGDRFGLAVAVNSDNEVIVGAPYHDLDADYLNSLTDSGAAFVFKKTTTWDQTQKLVFGTSHLGEVAPGRAANDLFGFSIASSGNDLLIGTPRRNVDPRGNLTLNWAGATVAFTRATSADDWEQSQIIVAQSTGPQANQRLGNSVSGHGDYFVTGSIGNAYDAAEDYYMVNAGAVQVWHNTGTEWELVQKLVASTGPNYGRNANANYGTTVKLLDTTLIVGAPGTTVDGVASSGAVFVYELVDGLFEEVQVLLNDGSDQPATKTADFGAGLDFDGETLVVGAPTAMSLTTGLALVGKIVTFTRNAGQFEQQQILRDPLSIASTNAGRMGLAVSVKDDIIIANATVESGNTGAAIIFRQTEGIWAFEDKIYSQREMADAMEFGSSVACDGTHLVVGAPRHAYNRLDRFVGTNAGAAYVFEFVDTDWKFKQKITPIGTNLHNASDLFGTAVEIKNGTIFVGAPGHRINGEGATVTANYGAVFTFELNPDGFFHYGTKLSPGGYNVSGPHGFGSALAVDGTVLVVGCPLSVYGASSEDVAATGCGSVMVFKKIDDTWTFVSKVAPTGTSAAAGREIGLNFGTNISFNDNYLAVGVPAARYDNDASGNLADAGAVYVYKFESLDDLGVTFVGGKPVTPAEAEIIINGGTSLFDSVNVTDSGSSYKGHPTVGFTSTAFAGYALMEPVGLANPKLTSILATYDDITVDVVRDDLDTTGSGATVEFTYDGRAIRSVDVTESGTGYTAVPTVTASSGVGVSLEAILEPTSVASLVLTETGSGFTVLPQILIDSPTAPGGVTAQAGLVVESESVSLNQTDVSYVGEKFQIAGPTPLILEATAIAGNTNVTAINLLQQGIISGLTSLQNVPTTRVIDTETFGPIIGGDDDDTVYLDYGSVALSHENALNYGSVTAPSDTNIDYMAGGFGDVTETEDWGLTTGSTTENDDWGSVAAATTSTEDWMVDASELPEAITYGPIKEAVVTRKYYGPIHESTLTVNLTAKLAGFTLALPGSGYQRVPYVSVVGTSVTPARAYATIEPTGVQSIRVRNGGVEVLDGTTLTITGANTTPATATANVGDGYINGILLTSAGSDYTRTPRLVFSNSGFAGEIELQPTTVASVETTKSDNTLTLTGRVLTLSRVTQPVGINRENNNLGSAMAASGSILAIGAPTNVDVSNDDTTVSNSGSILVYDIVETTDRENKVFVDGWMNGSAVMNDITADFTISLWFKTTAEQNAKNQGTLFGITNTSAGNAEVHGLKIDNRGNIQFAGHSTIGTVGSDWNHVVYVCDSGSVSVYLNGEIVGTATASGTFGSTSLFSIGAGFKTSASTEATKAPFYGYMSDIVVWKEALTSGQINSLATQPASSVRPGDIVANWVKN